VNNKVRDYFVTAEYVVVPANVAVWFVNIDGLCNLWNCCDRNWGNVGGDRKGKNWNVRRKNIAVGSYERN